MTLSAGRVAARPHGLGRLAGRCPAQSSFVTTAVSPGAPRLSRAQACSLIPCRFVRTSRRGWAVRVGSEFHLFDAKFRLDHFAIPEEGAIAEEEAASQGLVTRGWFKHADIHKRHAYKEAIGGPAGT